MGTASFIPANETQRLHAVQPYAQLPSRQALFQAMVELTARLFQAPMSIMSIVQAEQVQYSGNVGLPRMPALLAREDCICSTAVYTNTTTIFSDLWAQPCPWVSPAAQAQRDFQFYAGHPLLTAEGYAIGTLCVLDEVPRTFRPEEEAVLRQLATLAMQLLDLHLLLAERASAGPGLLAVIEQRLAFSTQRLETLTALARYAAPATAEPQRDLDRERQLIVADIAYAMAQAATQAKAQD